MKKTAANPSRRSFLRLSSLALFSLLHPKALKAATALALPSALPRRSASPVRVFQGNRWWENPERLRSGRKRPSGIMNWGGEALARYEQEVAYLDCGTQRARSQLPSWEVLAGGPLGKPDIIQPRSQLDWPGTPLGALMDHIPPGRGWLIWGVWAMKTGEAKRTQGQVWRQVAAGAFDQYYIDLGARAKRLLQAKGWSLDCLLLRWNKEFNQEDSYGITDGQRASTRMPQEVLDWYREAMGRVIAKFEEGYGPQARHIFSPARTFRLFDQPLASFFTPGAYDLVSLSYHPSGAVKDRKSWEKMIAGNLDGGYGDLEAIELCQKHQLPFCHDEWSPRFESKLGCRIPAEVYQWTWDFWNCLESEYGIPLAFDCIYSPTALTPSLYPEWGEGVKVFKKLWAGKKPAPARR